LSSEQNFTIMYKQAGIYTLKEIVLEYVGKCWKKNTKYAYFDNCPHLNKHSTERVLLSLLTNYAYEHKPLQ